MSVWSLWWHFTNKSVTGAPYSIKSYSLSHSGTLLWRVRWLKQCRLEVAAELQQYPWLWYQDCCVRDCSSAWLVLHRCWIWMCLVHHPFIVYKRQSESGKGNKGGVKHSEGEKWEEGEIAPPHTHFQKSAPMLVITAKLWQMGPHL